MKRSLSHFLFGVLLLLPQFLWGQNDSQPLYHYGMKEGLPSERVYWAMQDIQGYMWFATQAGVCQYDGYRAKVTTTSQGLSHNEVRSLFEDEQSRIWMLTQNGLSRKSKETVVRLDSLKRIGPKPVSSIYQVSADRYLLTSRSTLTLIQADTVLESKRLQSYGLQPNAQLVAKEAGLFWLADANILVGIGADLAVKKRVAFEYEGANPIDVPLLIAIGPETYLSPCKQGLVEIKTDGSQRLIVSAADFSHWGPVTDIKRDEQGDIWIALEDGGVLWLAAEANSYREIDCLLKQESIWHLFEDREGNLWITTDENGVWLFTSGAKKLYRYNLVEHRELKAIQQEHTAKLVDINIDNSNSIWFAWEDGQLLQMPKLSSLRTDRQAVNTYDIGPKLGSDDKVKHILGLKEGGLMIASEQKLWYFNQNRLAAIPLENAPISLHQVDKGDIFVGTDAVVGHKATLGNFLKAQPQWEPVFAPGLKAVAEDYEGNVLLAWMSGINIVEDGKDRRLNPTEEIFRSGVNDLATGDDSTLWFATNGSGLLVQHPQRSPMILNSSSGMRNEVCNTICVDKYRNLAWVGTQNGMGWICKDSLTGQTSLRWLDQRDGLAGNWVQQILRYEQHLLIRTKEGVTIMEPYFEFPSALAAPVYITEVLVNGRSLSINENNPVFPADSNNIELHFTGLGFRYPGELKFKYRLIGAGDGWQETKETRIPFANLSNGSYTFEVVAVDRNGIESEIPATLSFSVEPPFYRSFWFILSMILLVLALGVFLNQFVQTRQQKALLEHRVNEKTIELSNKVGELAQANHDLKQFAYVASHDLKTPLRTIVNYMQLLERRYKSRLDEQADEYISFAVRSSKRLYEMINNLLHYSELGTREDSEEPIDLNVVLDNVLTTLEGWLKERNAKVIAPKLPLLKGVEAEWELLFRNLIENGIKFNYSESPEIKIEIKDSPGFWIMAIDDNGIGIPEEYQHQIFQIFQRLHTEEFPGSGLGLAMCKRIVEKQGGQIWLESKPEEGTQVIFSIPKESELDEA
ncbi:MAG: ATP-binding protein [Bacteroidota bacterium]